VTTRPPGEGGARSTRLAEALRLIVITDELLAGERGAVETVHRALDAGARCIQLRRKGGAARETADVARALLPAVRAHDALLFVNDRADVAAAVGADGVHLGPEDVPLGAIRRAFGPDLLIGYSTDDPGTARRAVEEGADYLGCGAVFGTTSKDVGDEAIGLAGLRAVVEAVDVPVVGIGGVTPERAASVRATGAAGVAVIGAVMGAVDVGLAVRGLLGVPSDS
jgi:thiamine-phosphate diphosphorylase